jgi:signal transduction histidine kinase
MNDMLARVERGVARQQAFAADASHELRSPLTRMRSEIEVELATGANPDSATLRSVLEEASEMEHLLSDLLYLARSDAGDQPTRATTLDLDDVVLEEIGRRRGSERITIDASSVSAAQVWGDPIQLARAVRNLLDNAVRHARHTVTLSLTESGAEAILVVADDGPGIPADQAERIFERFARIDEGRTRRDGGTGLGLSITTDIVARHGGTVRVDPTVPAGARFEVRLPLDAPPPV